MTIPLLFSKWSNGRPIDDAGPLMILQFRQFLINTFQAGDDKKVYGCYYDHDSCEVVDDLRARLASVEKENEELKRSLKAQTDAIDMMKAR